MDSQAAIETLITDRIGIVILPKDRRNFEETIQARLKVKGQKPEEYLNFLKSGGEAVAEEWDKLHFSLTVGESYFFRDRGQMDLLHDVVFPALLRENAGKRSLKIWSAGCSTGEEPYSLAMMLDDLIPAGDDWNVQIVATDLNKHALEKARLGLYSDWSFRKMEDAERDRYFTHDNYEWQLDRTIRKMVTFREGNLARLDLPDPAADLADLDFIFCRNVFIYFGRETVERITRQMSRALRPGGYFLAGHGELFNLELPELRIEMHPGSMIHRKIEGKTPRTGAPAPPPAPGAPAATPPIATPLPAPTRPPAPSVAPSPDAGATSRPATPRRIPKPTPGSAPARAEQPPENPGPPKMAVGAEQESNSGGPAGDEFEVLEDLLRKQRYRDLVHRIGPIDAIPPGDPLLYLLARACANLGDHKNALLACERGLEGPGLQAEIMVLQAQIIEESGHPARALEILRKALYLAPDYVPAYLEMAEAYDLEGEPERARKQRQTALSLLKKLNSGTEIDRYEGVTVGDLTRDLEGILSRNDE